MKKCISATFELSQWPKKWLQNFCWNTWKSWVDWSKICRIYARLAKKMADFLKLILSLILPCCTEKFVHTVLYFHFLPYFQPQHHLCHPQHCQNRHGFHFLEAILIHFEFCNWWLDHNQILSWLHRIFHQIRRFQ